MSEEVKGETRTRFARAPAGRCYPNPDPGGHHGPRLDAPLVRHKIALLRDADTDTQTFRQLVGELGQLSSTRRPPTLT